MVLRGGSLGGRDIAHQRHQESGDSECDHNGAEGVCVSERRRFAVGECPQLFERGDVAGLRAAWNRAVALHHPVHQSDHRSIRRRQVGSNRDEVEVRSCVRDCPAHGDADGAAEIPHHVEQTACVFQPLRRQAAKTEVDSGGDSEDLRQTSQDLRHKKLIPSPVVCNVAETPHRQAEASQPRHHQPARVDLAG